jgi:predicted dehydrogenase
MSSTAVPIRWGILGAGGIAATVSSDIAASPDSVLQAVGARDAARAAAFAAAHGVARSYGSYAELVADPDVDVVYVATTHAQHHEHALLALGAGKPVLVEKAFTLNARQAREVVRAARTAGLFCMEAMWMRFNPLVRRAQQIATSGRIGSIVSVRADFSRRFPYSPQHRLFDLAAGGGALLDLGIYPVTLAWLFLGHPGGVAVSGKLAETGSDATVAMQWVYPDGAFAQLCTSAVSPSPFGAIVCGTEGWLQFEPEMHRPTRLIVNTPDGDEVLDEPIVGNGYGFQIAEVQRCLRAGETESPLVPLDETVAILELLDEVRAELGVHYPADG